jgi:hypothetical protein
LIKNNDRDLLHCSFFNLLDCCVDRPTKSRRHPLIPSELDALNIIDTSPPKPRTETERILFRAQLHASHKARAEASPALLSAEELEAVPDLLSPSSFAHYNEHVPAVDAALENDEEEDVFFGPVTATERCVQRINCMDDVSHEANAGVKCSLFYLLLI